MKTALFCLTCALTLLSLSRSDAAADVRKEVASDETSKAETKKQKRRVFFRNLHEGDKVVSPFRVEFGIEGMKVVPLAAPKDDEGHHHLIIQGESIEAGQMIPADEKHIHYGQGQTEAEVSLPPGKHKLTLQFANGLHQSYGKELSASINIEVVEKK